MSWFPQQTAFHTTPVPQELLTDEAEGTEIAPGVIIERRFFLWLAAGATATTVWPGSALGNASLRPGKQPPASEATELELPQLIEQLSGEAETLISTEEPDEETYLASVAERLGECPQIEMANFHANRPIEFSYLRHQRPLVVVQIRFEAGAQIPLHDHHEYNGVLFGMEGQVQVRNFDYLNYEEARESNGTFQIRETQRAVLGQGDSSTLSRTRDNIHEAVGGDEGGVVLDIFTFFSNDAGSSYLDFNNTPIEGEEDVYDVSWY